MKTRNDLEYANSQPNENELEKERLVTISNRSVYHKYAEVTIPIPKHIKKEVGNKVEIQIENDIPFKAAISAISKTSITLDANPEFIKKDLVIKVELLDIEVEST